MASHAMLVFDPTSEWCLRLVAGLGLKKGHASDTIGAAKRAALVKNNRAVNSSSVSRAGSALDPCELVTLPKLSTQRTFRQPHLTLQVLSS
jgi:hypothetical protein